MATKRLFVEKKKEYDFESLLILNEIQENTDVKNLMSVRVIRIYDIKNIDEEEYEVAKYSIFSSPNSDVIYEEEPKIKGKFLIISLKNGLYDQTAESAKECLRILKFGKSSYYNKNYLVKTSKMIIFDGDISNQDLKKIEKYIVNPIEYEVIDYEKQIKFYEGFADEKIIKNIDNFVFMNEEELVKFSNEQKLTLDIKDLKFCQNYFKNVEKRNPTETELKIIDTYWSDHCRHTTFNTILNDIEIKNEFLKCVYEDYLKTRVEVYNSEDKKITFMDLATIYAKKLKKNGKLKNLDESCEINAAGFIVDVPNEYNEIKKWIIMFKNETHNHPTEIEPFGGAATCLGGVIRDPLSARAYVYQSMRISGCGNPVSNQVISGKLSQKKITTGAASGYSSYGNQIGVATGFVHEIYNKGYVAKRFECGFVIGAVLKENVFSKKPDEIDVVILIGGNTGIDGCGGATGSSRSHDVETVEKCASQVQKGNPLEERKIQRLFRKKDVTKLIKKCNDFGAGGICVAIGELADGILINLDNVPKKYENISGLQLAISESQERMAVVVSRVDAQNFIKECEKENLKSTIVADVIRDNRMRMIWNGNAVVDIHRKFLDSSGCKKYQKITVEDYEFSNGILNKCVIKNLKSEILKHMSDINLASQLSLSSKFDSTVGGNSVFVPYGGKYQLTPQQTMVSKLPMQDEETDFATAVSFGCNPDIAIKNPFLASVYSIVESVAKLVAVGCDFRKIYFSFQEYFEKLDKNPKKWGMVFAALLGCFYTQKKLEIPSICGKDSMSGSYGEMHVPPTFVSFAVGSLSARKSVSSDFKEAGHFVFLLLPEYEKNGDIDFESLKKNYIGFEKILEEKKVYSSYSVESGGIVEAICKMSFGNKVGFKFSKKISFSNEELFRMLPGSIIFETDIIDVPNNLNGIILGKTTTEPKIYFFNQEFEEEFLKIDEIINVWKKQLEKVFEHEKLFVEEKKFDLVKNVSFGKKNIKCHSYLNFAKPMVFIPIFPGTNCEFETIRNFEKVGAICKSSVFRNIKKNHIAESIEEFVLAIKSAQILTIPGGFSGGDEPDGSGKFIDTIFRNCKIREAVIDFLYKRNGLVLGICNGFQALIRLGLLPFGEIRKIDEDSPMLMFNKIGHHMSRIVNVKITSIKSPWFSEVCLGDVHTIAISHSEGRFIASEQMMKILEKNGQIASQYVDLNGNATLEFPYNPNGSMYALEALTSEDGRILGKMGHSERVGKDIHKNVPGNSDQKIFESGVKYFR
ncbi:MAG: phosphoribosylformylglycinamidine synthase [Clostridiales bacterium]|nr:phosphoribosylformylglycinamidine synthase [Clostridiales bacterium]